MGIGPIQTIACAAGFATAALLFSACGGPRLESKAVGTRTYTSQAACGQHLVSTELTARGAEWGESITVMACGERDISGYVEVDVELKNGGRMPWTGSFGRRSDNGRCLVSDSAIATRGDNAAEDGAATSGGGDKSTTRSAGPPAEQTPDSFREVMYRGEVCRYTMRTVMDLGKLRKGSAIRVRLWSKEPNDLRGAVVRLVHNIAVPNVSEKKWRRHLAKKEAKRTKRAAKRERNRDGKVSEAELRRRLAEAETYREYEAERAGQPAGRPPRARAEGPPPRRSGHAEWVHGYWHWTDRDWVWMRGQWRVPDADVRDGLTVRAPHAPPPLRAETRPIRPAQGAIWVAGYWQWNGSVFVWVPGAWVIAPHAGRIWAAPSWRVVGGGVVFVPGGWRSRQ